MGWPPICDHTKWLCRAEDHAPLPSLLGPGKENKTCEGIEDSWRLIHSALLLGYLLYPCFEMNTLAWLSFPRENDVTCFPAAHGQDHFFWLVCHTGLNQHLRDTDALKDPANCTFLNNPWHLYSAGRPDSSQRLSSCTLYYFLNESHRKLGKLKPIYVSYHFSPQS